MDDPTVQTWMDDLNKLFKQNKFVIYYLPQVARLFPESTGMASRQRFFENLLDTFAAEVKHHSETLDPNEPRDFIDMYLIEGTQEGSKEHFKDTRQLLTIIMDLFQAGSETTSTTLKWSLLFMALNEDIQCRCREEIWTSIGRDRQPTSRDVAKLPFCRATIMEVQRLSCVVPASLQRRARTDMQLAGYNIPKDTAVLVNHLHLMMSAELALNGQDPAAFDPSRFLDGREVNRNVDAFMPFGSGKRSCPGETLAKASLEIFFIQLLQKLRFRPPADEKHPQYPDPKKVAVGATRMCKDFYVRIDAAE